MKALLHVLLCACVFCFGAWAYTPLSCELSQGSSCSGNGSRNGMSGSGLFVNTVREWSLGGACVIVFEQEHDMKRYCPFFLHEETVVCVKGHTTTLAQEMGFADDARYSGKTITDLSAGDVVAAIVKPTPQAKQCLSVERTVKPPTLINKGQVMFLTPGERDAHILSTINAECGTFRTLDGNLDKRGQDIKKLEQNLYKPVEGDACERISVEEFMSNGFVSNYLLRSKPVLIAGLAKSWDAYATWTAGYLKQTCVTSPHLRVLFAPNGEFEGVEPRSKWQGADSIPQYIKAQLPYPDLVVVRPASLEMRCSDFMELLSRPRNASGSAYLEYTEIASTMPSLLKDLPGVAPLGHLLETKHVNMWLSDGNTVGKLHFDAFENIMGMLRGSKTFIVYPPYNNTQLYEAHIPEAKLAYNLGTDTFTREHLMDSTSMVMSPVDLQRPNPERFPEFRHATSISCHVQEGDALFLPSFWWHEVVSAPNTKEHRNLAVNYWFQPIFEKEYPCPTCPFHFDSKFYDLI
eukprot:m.324128 g.324128  ORF g.324128 m.324128 type:complete len:519 (+) comp16008_c0_seq4:132-1688(+)